MTCLLLFGSLTMMGDKRYNSAARLDHKPHHIWDGGNIYLGVTASVNDILEKF